MPKPTPKKKANVAKAESVTTAVATSAPDIIVDFIFDDGLFFIAVENIGDRPALKVSARFDKNFFGVGGKEEISRLPLFRNIEFMPPHKKIVTFLDTSTAYFQRKEPTKLSVAISYKDQGGKTYRGIINHDLEIYKRIGYIRRVRNNPDEKAD